MKKFLVTYHMPIDMLENRPEPTPEQQKEGWKVWHDWKDRMGEHLIDLGAPLHFPHRIDGKANPEEVKNTLAGYSIIQANDMEEALELMKQHPHIGWADGPYLEIHPFGEMS